MLPFIIFFFLFRKVLERMVRGGGVRGGGRGNGRRSARATDDAAEAMDDVRAEVEGVSAALETGESSAAAEGAPGAPAEVLRRRLDKARAEAEQAKSDADKAIKEKEAMQKQMDEMRAALELAKSNVGDVVPVAENLVETPARKVKFRFTFKFRCVRHIPDSNFPQRQRTKAVATAAVCSVPLPAQGSIVSVFTDHGQTYIRDIQKELVPRVIAYSGFRFHNSLCRPEMLQILRYITIRKGGVYVHWDALAARSEKGKDVRALGIKLANSHAHAARKHSVYVMEQVAKLFRATPNDKKLCFVKEEVFGIADGGPIIGPDHPAMLEMFAQPITGAL